jgi:hypothetical protein
VELYYRYLCERPFVGESYDRSSVTNDIRRVIFWTVQSVHWIFPRMVVECCGMPALGAERP